MTQVYTQTRNKQPLPKSPWKIGLFLVVALAPVGYFMAVDEQTMICVPRALVMTGIVAGIIWVKDR